jgi:hypothetical protein
VSRKSAAADGCSPNHLFVHTKVTQVIASVKRKNTANPFEIIMASRKKKIEAWRKRVQLEERERECVEANNCTRQVK